MSQKPQASPKLTIRRAAPGDAIDILEIYRPIVERTAISFETDPPTEADLLRRIEAANATHAWLVAEAAGKVAGYAYATPHRARAAYRFSVETSVYVHPDHHRQGVGILLYEHLFTELARLGFFHAFAGITWPNSASAALHARAGFRRIGTFPKVGFKHGRWHDVSWWHRSLQPGTPKARGASRCPVTAGSGVRRR